MTRMPCHITDERVPGDPQDALDYDLRQYTVYILCDDGEQHHITLNAFDEDDAEQLAMHEASYRGLRPVEVIETWPEETLAWMRQRGLIKEQS